MALKNNYVIEGHQANLALFQQPYVDTAIESIEWVDYRPVSQITRGATIEFSVPGHGLNYIDLKSTKLYIKVRILRPDGSPVQPSDTVGLINTPLSSIFRQVDVSLNQQVISPGIGTNYGYKGYFDLLLRNAEDAKQSQLQSQLYYKDTAGFMDNVDPVEGPNFGLVQRYAWTKDGNAVELEGPIYVDIMQQDRFLLNGVQINVKLFPASDAFSLMSTHSDIYRIDIVDAKLKLCTVKVSPKIVVSHNAALSKTPALYPFNRSEIKAYSIPAGLLTWSMDDLFLGNVPDRVVVGLTNSLGFSGSVSKNPFNFNDMNVNYMGFFVDGTSLPTVPFTPDYTTNAYVTPFLSLFQGTGKYMKDDGNYIERLDYPNGYAIQMFDLASNHSGEIDTLQKKGQTRLSIQFSQALPSTTTVIVYGTFPAMLQIDQSRNVMVN